MLRSMEPVCPTDGASFVPARLGPLLLQRRMRGGRWYPAWSRSVTHSLVSGWWTAACPVAVAIVVKSKHPDCTVLWNLERELLLILNKLRKHQGPPKEAYFCQSNMRKVSKVHENNHSMNVAEGKKPIGSKEKFSVKLRRTKTFTQQVPVTPPMRNEEKAKQSLFSGASRQKCMTSSFSDLYEDLRISLEKEFDKKYEKLLRRYRHDVRMLNEKIYYLEDEIQEIKFKILGGEEATNSDNVDARESGEDESSNHVLSEDGKDESKEENYESEVGGKKKSRFRKNHKNGVVSRKPSSLIRRVKEEGRERKKKYGITSDFEIARPRRNKQRGPLRASSIGETSKKVINISSSTEESQQQTHGRRSCFTSYAGSNVLSKLHTQAIDLFLSKNYKDGTIIWENGFVSVNAVGIYNLLGHAPIDDDTVDAYLKVLEIEQIVIPTLYKDEGLFISCKVQQEVLKKLHGEESQEDMIKIIKSLSNSVQLLLGNIATAYKAKKGHRYIFMPLNTDWHWHLLVYDLKNKTFRSLNSLQAENYEKACLNMIHFLATWLLDTLKINAIDDPVDFVRECEQQDEASIDCGVFMLRFVEGLMEGSHNGSHPLNTTNYRGIVAARLLRSPSCILFSQISDLPYPLN